MKQKLPIFRSFMVSLLLMVGLLTWTITVPAGRAMAAAPLDACSPTGTTYGTDTMTIAIPATATYQIYVRLQVPATSANSLLLNIDNATGTNCYNVGGSSVAANSWTWVNYYDGSTANVIQTSLSQGNHTLVLTGTQSGVSVDRIEALGVDGSGQTCVPTGTGDTCVTDTTPPTTSISSGPASSTTSTSATFNFTGTDDITPTGSLTFQCQLDSAAYSACTSPKAYTGLSVGSHTFNVKATDAAGNTDTTAATQTWTITSGGGGTTPPSVPTALHSTATTGTGVTLTWDASTDSGGPGVAGYRVYRDGSSTAIGSTTTTSYTDSGLTLNTIHSYTAAAYNSASPPQVSAQSPAVSVCDSILSKSGDIDCDNHITGHDLSIFLGNYSTNYPLAEFDGSGIVEGHDLSILLGNYGK